MKKVLLILFSAFLLVGCGNKTVELNFEEIQKNVEETEVFGSLKVVSNEEMYNMHSIDSALAEEILYIETTDPNKVDTYIIVKVKDEKIKEQIKASFDAIETQAEMYNQANAYRIKNRLETTYEGYDIYIVSDDNQKVLEAIKANN